jgi:hypothetical protein
MKRHKNQRFQSFTEQSTVTGKGKEFADTENHNSFESFEEDEVKDRPTESTKTPTGKSYLWRGYYGENMALVPVW